MQYGGGGFNGVLISGLGLVAAARFDQPSPLAQGYATVGTDSGHAATRDQPPQIFALNDEAFHNFSHQAYKKVRDVSVALMRRAYGEGPRKLYFLGSSEGGREALTMAQRYPDDFDGIFARAPVINWTGLQHAGNPRRPGDHGRGLVAPGAGQAGRRGRAERRPARWTALSEMRRDVGRNSTPRGSSAHRDKRRRLPEPGAGRRRQHAARAV